jgi:membrane-associated protease RseP (regulator of RpoE activity)
LPGVIYYQDPEIGGVAAFCFWVAAVLVSLLAHEIGHILAARLFGVHPRIVLTGLGGQVFGLDKVKRGPRLLIGLAGALANLLIYGLAWSVTSEAFPLPLAWRFALVPAMWLLMWINIFWGLLNLLPLWPLDGGRIAVEVGEALLGRRGQTLALLLSLVVSFLLMIYVVVWMRLTLINPFDVHYRVYLEYFCIQAIYCYAFWLSAFRALWGDHEPADV